MQLEEFNYDLPPELIADKPLSKRDESKLLYLSKDGKIKDAVFKDLVSFLKAGDVLVFNNSKVIPARLEGEIEGKKAEATLLKSISSEDTSQVWRALTKPSKRFKKGSIFNISEDFCAEILEEKLLGSETGEVTLKFPYDLKNFFNKLEKYGFMPLPPYIAKKRKPDRSDENSYQTVYAEKEGSVAAPTAGLHFTEELLTALKAKGVEFAYVTLHVGAGTFLPVKTDNIKNHKMHSEYFEISKETAEKINKAKSENRRIIPVGTTSLRSLESAPFESGKIKEYFGETSIFIYPSYEFKIPDCLITNFHLPKSTLLMLVSAFATTESIKLAYRHAVENNYRFFSYGDACFLEKADKADNFPQ